MQSPPDFTPPAVRAAKVMAIAPQRGDSEIYNLLDAADDYAAALGERLAGGPSANADARALAARSRLEHCLHGLRLTIAAAMPK